MEELTNLLLYVKEIICVGISSNQQNKIAENVHQTIKSFWMKTIMF